MRFELVNVFTTHERNSGNQLAVVYPEKKLSDEEMLSISKYFNYNETIFVHDDYDLRIFTPKVEFPFAGHPTIGAASRISIRTKKKNFTLSVPLGILEVECAEDSARVTYPGSPVIEQFSGDINEILRLSSVEASQVHLNQVKKINAGPDFVVIPLKSLGALQKSTSPIFKKDPIRSYYIFQEAPEKFHVRMFTPFHSAGEDAATGSAACALAAFCRDVMGEVSGKAVISQGIQMGKPSEIRVQWNKTSIKLEGKVFKWAEGTL